jgi:hypothetical protein
VPVLSMIGQGSLGQKRTRTLDPRMPDERSDMSRSDKIQDPNKISRLVVWPHVASAANQLHVKNLAVIVGVFQTTDRSSMTAGSLGLGLGEKIKINENLSRLAESSPAHKNSNPPQVDRARTCLRRREATWFSSIESLQ